MGEVISNFDGSRSAITHPESGVTFWAWGPDIIASAHEQIDFIYDSKWAWLKELIEAGDFHGPNVRVLVESGSGDGTEA